MKEEAGASVGGVPDGMILAIEIHGLYDDLGEYTLDREHHMECRVKEALRGASYERETAVVKMQNTEEELQYRYGPFLYVRGEKEVLYKHCEDLQKRLRPLNIGVRFEKIMLFMPAEQKRHAAP